MNRKSKQTFYDQEVFQRKLCRGSHWTNFHEIWYEYFSKISRENL